VLYEKDCVLAMVVFKIASTSLAVEHRTRFYVYGDDDCRMWSTIL